MNTIVITIFLCLCIWMFIESNQKRKESQQKEQNTPDAPSRTTAPPVDVALSNEMNDARTTEEV